MTIDPSTGRRTSRLRSAFSRHYLLTLWLPVALTIAALMASVLSYPWHLRSIGYAFGGIFVIGLLYLFVSAVVRFSRKRVAGGFLTVACLALALGSIVPAFFLSLFAGFVGAGDGFANGLTIPDGTDAADPASKLRPVYQLKNAPDDFQAALLAALESSPNPAGALALSLPSLERLEAENRDLLLRYLSAHPAWRVYTERGRLNATRRWRSGGTWIPELHNYYSRFHAPYGPRFQSRTNIGLGGEPWGGKPQMIEAGVPTPIVLKSSNSMGRSHIGIRAGELLVEQFEQSHGPARPITSTALAMLETEFAALLADPTWAHARSLLPEDAIVSGQPDIMLSGSGGIYASHVRCNPGEPGVLWLQAYEITRDYQLSERKIQNYTNERIGWSGDGSELFLSAAQFTVREGDWDEYYAARFEVWFRPDSGEPDRKLVEKIFRIEGWEH